MGMGIDQWEYEGMEILTVFPNTSSMKHSRKYRPTRENNKRVLNLSLPLTDV